MNDQHAKVAAWWWVTLFLGGVLSALVWFAVVRFYPDYKLHVHFYDIGQGDATFITSMAGTRALIDGGPGRQILEKLGADLPFWARDIDLLVLTHPHADHVTGLVEVLKRYHVKNVLMTEIPARTEAYKTFKNLLDEQRVHTIIARAGQNIRLDGSTVLRVLYPLESLAGKEFTPLENATNKVGNYTNKSLTGFADPNETSIVSRLSFGASDFLLTGDAPKTLEQKILDSHQPIASEVLKVGHQGSRTSTGESFLQSVHPDLAVIFVGKGNQYGHPHAETLQTLEAQHVRYFRTDRDGDIRLVSDGKEIKKL